LAFRLRFPLAIWGAFTWAFFRVLQLLAVAIDAPTISRGARTLKRGVLPVRQTLGDKHSEQVFLCFQILCCLTFLLAFRLRFHLLAIWDAFTWAFSRVLQLLALAIDAPTLSGGSPALQRGVLPVRQAFGDKLSGSSVTYIHVCFQTFLLANAQAGIGFAVAARDATIVIVKVHSGGSRLAPAHNIRFASIAQVF